MKKILAILLLLPFATQAQKLQICLNGGGSINLINSLNTTNTMSADSNPFFSPIIIKDNNIGNISRGGTMGLLKILLHMGEWQIGAGVETGRQSGQVRDGGILSNSGALNYFSYRYLNPQIVVNKKLVSFSKANLYLGISGGPSFASDYAYNTKGGGFMAGMQFGFEYVLPSHLSLTAETGMRYSNHYFNYTVAKSGGIRNEYKESTSLLQMPLTVGVRYAF